MYLLTKEPPLHIASFFQIPTVSLRKLFRPVSCSCCTLCLLARSKLECVRFKYVYVMYHLTNLSSCRIKATTVPLQDVATGRVRVPGPALVLQDLDLVLPDHALDLVRQEDVQSKYLLTVCQLVPSTSVK